MVVISTFWILLKYKNAIFFVVHKGILVIMQGYIGVSEQGLWIRLIDQLVGPIGLIKQLEPILV